MENDALKASRSIWGVWKYLLPCFAFLLASSLPAFASNDSWNNTAASTSYYPMGSDAGHEIFYETIVSDFNGTLYGVDLAVKKHTGTAAAEFEFRVYDAACSTSLAYGSFDRTLMPSSETFEPYTFNVPITVTAGTSYCVRYAWDNAPSSNYVDIGLVGGFTRKRVSSSSYPSPTISATNTPATTGGIAWSGHFVIFGAGESYRDSPRFLIYTGGAAIQTLGYGTYDTTTTDLTYFASGAEESNYAWPAGTYQVVVEQPTNLRTYSATATVTVASHTNPSSAGTSILGFVDANGNIITPSAPGLKVATFSSYSACLELSLSGFSCLLNTSLANLAGLPIINIITSLPQNWAYAVNAPTSTLQINIGVPSFQGGAATQWLIYDSTSSTLGVMGSSPAFIATTRTTMVNVIDILMIFGLLLVAIDFFRGFI